MLTADEMLLLCERANLITWLSSGSSLAFVKFQTQFLWEENFMWKGKEIQAETKPGLRGRHPSPWPFLVYSFRMSVKFSESSLWSYAMKLLFPCPWTLPALFVLPPMFWFFLIWFHFFCSSWLCPIAADYSSAFQPCMLIFTCYHKMMAYQTNTKQISENPTV